VIRREDGFTLLEMLVVLVVIGVLAGLALGFQLGARERAGDAAARSNIRAALPAVEGYRTDFGGYTGMTLETLEETFGHGIHGVEILAAAATSYCVRATAEGRTWYKAGPEGEITQTACP